MERFYEVSHCFKMYCEYCFDEAEKMGMRGHTTNTFYIAAEQVKMGVGQIAIHAEGSHVRRMLAERRRPRRSCSGLFVRCDCKEFDILMYMVHTSRGHIVDLIKHLHTQGTPIISETLVYLGTTAHELESQGMRFQRKIKLPIRHQTDQERLGKAFRGTDTCMGTDAIHATSNAKLLSL